jgi:hypothetical protein
MQVSLTRMKRQPVAIQMMGMRRLLVAIHLATVVELLRVNWLMKLMQQEASIYNSWTTAGNVILNVKIGCITLVLFN